MHKYIIKFLLLLAIHANSGCNNQNHDSAEISKFKITNFEPSDNPVVYGDWTMCAYSSDGQIIRSNVCKIVSFKENGTGVIIFGDGSQSDPFTWTLKNNVLITSVKAGKNDYFINGTFKAFIASKDGRFNLVIINSANNTEYFLSK